MTVSRTEAGDRPPPDGLLEGQGFDAGTPTITAIRWFIDRYGYEPAWVVSTGGGVLAGPVKGEVEK